MSKRIVILLSSSLLGIIGYAACKPGTDCDFRMCAVDDDGGAQEGAADALVPDVVVPENCDELADAKSPEAAACIDDGFAVFVNAAGGSDTNPGTKAQPLKSLGNAIQKAAGSGKGRIYMCNGAPYEESVKLTTAVSLIGGFTCGTWQYDGAPSKIAPPKSGYALHIDGASSIVVSDLDLTAKSGEADGESSVAVFVNASKVRFVRSSLNAGNGKKGKDGESGITGKLILVVNGKTGQSDDVLSPVGYAAQEASGGASKECTCEGAIIKSQGGGGGNAGSDGSDGKPDLGQGKGGDVAACSMSGTGSGIGAKGPDKKAISAIDTVGALEASGWEPASGEDGTEVGGVGQGGGGGAGVTGGGGGGGGGCGGCGGLPGNGGQGGGASIALLVVDSEVSFVSGKLAGGSGGDGGKGGAGGEGGSGGGGGNGGGGGACQGGKGGTGGKGSAAGGGAGGLAYGVLYRGTAPALDPDTTAAITFGEAGKGGPGGKPGKSPDGNDGPAGRSGKVANVNEL